ncbi:MAG: D-alanyl-D-alanine carboxypeptidase, partial [Rhodospirillales bacterium]|nr:D-alanyl-D-alanine carboxypeptidase [Rhodospirillales bacterium]
GTMAILAICTITLGTLTATSGQSLAGGRHAALIVDANTGRVLHAQFADEPRYPASLAKMMTLYIVFEQLQQGRLKPSSRIKISENAANTPPSRLDLEPGSEITVGDAVKALITKSANDIAVAVAEHISGSTEKFAALMTQKARAVGMGSTVFKNPHGLPDANQVTTARDMVTLALRLNDHFPRYYALFATRTFAYNGSLYRNHNTLLGRFEGTDGIKTGYTSASGFNLVSSVRRDGKHIVGAIFGGSTAASRNAHMKTLLTRALHNASDEKTRRPALIAKAPSEERPAPRPVAARREQAARGAVTSVSESPFAQRARRTAGDAPRRSPESREQVHSADAGTETAPRIVPTPPIQIARVRSVSVVPRSRGVDAQSLPEVRTADAGAARVQPLTANDADTGALGGTEPSTLDRQAERLALGQLALAATRWTPPAHTPPTERRSQAAEPSKTGFAVQVGAYSSESEARRQLQIAQMRAAALLDGRSALTQRIENSGKQYYRARFSGFDSHDAASACSQLKRQQIDCLVAKME